MLQPRVDGGLRPAFGIHSKRQSADDDFTAIVCLINRHSGGYVQET